MIFLAGVDKKRYGKLVEDLNNNFLAGKDNYPESIDSTLTLLSDYQDHSSAAGLNVGNGEGVFETSFAQYQKRKLKNTKQASRVTCFDCGERGHVKKDCPNKKNHMQQDDDDSDEDSTGSRCPGWSG